MLEKQRHQLLLDTLAEQSFVSVSTLTERFGISDATARRDIAKLAEQGRLRKIRGGAQVLDTRNSTTGRARLNSSNFLVNKDLHSATKRLIAKRAVEICEDGESIIINGGSSTYMMAEFLSHRRISVLTNSFYLAQELFGNSDIQITLPGGEIYREQGIVLSSFENDTIQYYHGSKMFMGTPGIGDFGVMESDPLLIRAEQKLARQADELVILADSSKLGKRSNFIFESLDKVDTLITDSGASEPMLALFRHHGLQVILVEKVD